MRRIAIIGLGPSGEKHPPDWERWGVPWDSYAPQYDRLFEPHDRALWETRKGNYLERLQSMTVPIYMQKTHKDIPMSMEYPLEQMQQAFGDYFGSTPAYMLAFAVACEPDVIGLWGIDLKDDYDHQRPNLEYLIGIGVGRGIQMHVSQESRLMTHRPEDVFNGKTVIYPERYGYGAHELRRAENRSCQLAGPR